MARRTKKRRSSNKSRLSQLESLETRYVLAANVFFNNSVVFFEGTAQADAVQVTVADNELRLLHNSELAFSRSIEDVVALHLSSGAGPDVIINDTQLSATILGGAGDDSIIGGGGSDFVYGGTGADTVHGGGGDDVLMGHLAWQNANDPLDVNADGIRSAIDALFIINSVNANGTTDLPLDEQAVNASIFSDPSGDNTVSPLDALLIINDLNDPRSDGEGEDSAHQDGADQLFGQDGDDSLLGHLGNDRLDGGPGNDAIWGHGDDDLLIGGAGKDELHGGPGDDMLAATESDDLVDEGTGSDVVNYPPTIEVESEVTLMHDDPAYETEITTSDSTNDAISLKVTTMGDTDAAVVSVVESKLRIEPKASGRIKVKITAGDGYHSTSTNVVVDLLTVNQVLSQLNAVRDGVLNVTFKDSAREESFQQALDNVTEEKLHHHDSENALNLTSWDDVERWTKEKANAAGSGLKQLGQSVVSSMVGIPEDVAKSVVDLVKAIEATADDPSQETILNLMRTAFRGVVTVGTSGYRAAIGLIVDVFGEVRGEWYGRRLKSDEAALAKEIFGNTIDVDEVRIIEDDPLTINDRAHVHGTTISWPTDVEGDLTNDGDVLTFVHELSHVVQKQMLFSVAGRAVLDQAYYEFEPHDEEENTVGHDWLAGPPDSGSGVYSPKEPDGLDRRTYLTLNGPESHASLVEQMYAFFRVLEYLDNGRALPSPLGNTSSFSDVTPHVTTAIRNNSPTPTNYQGLLKAAERNQQYPGWKDHFELFYNNGNTPWFADWLNGHGVRQANVFGHVKNASLRAQGENIESMAGHRNWALQKSDDRVKSAIKGHVEKIQDNGWRNITEVFAWTKNATFLAQGKPTEDPAGHRNWASKAHPLSVANAITGHLNSLNSIYNLGLTSADVNFAEKFELAIVFAQLKNASLLSQKEPIESLGGHINWAMGQSDSRIKASIRDHLENVLQYGYRDFYNVFAHLKNASLLASGEPVEHLGGHVNWAKGETVARVGESVIGHVNRIKDKFDITLSIAIEVELPADLHIIEAFGHLKNAGLLAQGNEVESHSGHTNWASQQKERTVKNAMRAHIDHISQGGWKKIETVFAYTKNSVFAAEKSELESIAGHINWAKQQSPSRVVAAINGHINKLNSIIGLGLDDNFKTEFGEQYAMANVHAHLKNAALLAKRSDLESIGGHVNWAMGQSLAVVKSAMKANAETVISKAYVDYYNVFAHLKNAGLLADDTPIEDLGGHVNWAKGQTVARVAESYVSHLKQITERFNISLVTPIVVETPADLHMIEAYGHLKNASLLAQGKDVEAHSGHVNWARQQRASTVRSSMLDHIGHISADGWRKISSVFAYTKNSALAAENKAIESIGGHENWANKNSPSTVVSSLHGHLRILNSQFRLGLPDNYKTAFGSRFVRANAFAHLKNASLLAQKKSLESVGGHINWAMGASDSSVKSAMVGHLKNVLQLGWRDFYNVYAHLKNAGLLASGKVTESLSGHVNWAKGQTVARVGQAMEGHVSTITSAFSLTLGISNKAALPAEKHLVQAFAYLKNAGLISQGKSVESHSGHVNWAQKNKSSTVKSAMATHYNSVISGAWRDINRVFAYTKNASLVASGKAAESISGHINWAKGQSASRVGSTIEGHLRNLRSVFGLSVTASPSVDLPTETLLAEVFGLVKNAYLKSQGKSAESQGGHVNWAKSKSRNTVRSYIRSYLNTIESQHKTMSRTRLNWSQAYLKQARLYSQGTRDESISGHYNWSKKQSKRSSVESSVRYQIGKLREIWGV